MSAEQDDLPHLYWGELTPREIAAVSHAAQYNAKSLIMSAEHLLDCGHFSSSVALSIIAIEECGKAYLIADVGMSTNKTELQKAWKSFRNHTEKNLIWFYGEFAKRFIHKEPRLEALLAKPGSTAKGLDYIKQLALYSDVYDDRIFTVPFTAFKKEQAQLFIDYAKMFSEFSIDTEKEVALWIKYMKPIQASVHAKKVVPAEVYEALIAFAKEAYGDNQEKYHKFLEQVEKYLGKPS